LRSFEDVLLRGLADDGGLFVPERVPLLDGEAWKSLCGLPYAELAARVMAFFAGDSFSLPELSSLAKAAYRSFRHPAVAPLRQLDERLWLQELFHGPSLSFKDLALQFLGQLFDRALARRGEVVTIVGATSGDTGAAAIAACRDKAAIDLFILYPLGRISDVQRRQMTTVEAANVHVLAIEGSFDDCQDLVKALFADVPLRERLGLAAINSINWARIAAQIVYYLAAGLALGAPERLLSFSVPTGNFGNVYAGHLARRMGLPLARLVIGTNKNDILARYLEKGHMEIEAVAPSLSPAMDIQVPSNFERLLFELLGREGGAVAETMLLFRQRRALPENAAAWHAARGLFAAKRVDDDETMATIAKVHAGSGVLIDPHTAVAIAAGGSALETNREKVPMIVLASAHPAKFPEAVERATGIRPPLPPTFGDLFERPERIFVLRNDLAAVRGFIESRAKRSAKAP
jgi:threonine synthase